MKPLASLSLDLDNQWSYMKTHGNLEWQTYPSYLDTFMPMVLELLDQLSLKITFFIVGQDAFLKKNEAALKLITKGGHEVGNHSFSHEPWLHLLSKDQIQREVSTTEGYIFRVTGQKPLGFRGPGFSWSPDLLEVLAENGYMYDTSTLPTYLGPVARMYYLRSANLTKEKRAQRKKLFGDFKDGLKPVKPYIWHLSTGMQLLEIPVTTIPIIKSPFHLSYLLYLSRFSELLMVFYLNLAIFFCKLSDVTPCYLLHPLDLIGGDKLKELSFFPAMDLSFEKKINVFTKVINQLRKHFHLVNISTLAKHLLASGNLRTVK